MMTSDAASQPVPVADVEFLDGAAVVFVLNPGTTKTFQDYADNAFVPYVKFQLERTSRLDIIWGVCE